MNSNDDESDDAATKPVSSLRSQFESLSSTKHNTLASSTQSGQTKPSNVGYGHEAAAAAAATAAATAVAAPPEPYEASDMPKQVSNIAMAKRRPPSPPKPRRPASAIHHFPTRPTPEVNITSPKSPPKLVSIAKHMSHQHGSLTPTGLRSDMHHEHPTSHFRIPSRSTDSGSATASTSTLQALDVARPFPTRQSSLQPHDHDNSAKAPPPVNRGAKPLLGKAILDRPSQVSTEGVTKSADRKVSPFSTPPSSNESSPAQSPPPLPIHSKPKPPTIQAVAQVRSNTGENPPGLPPRRNVIPSRSQEVISGTKSKPSALTQGFSNKTQPIVSRQALEQDQPRNYRNLTPPPRLSNEGRRVPQHSRESSVGHATDYDSRVLTTDAPIPNLSDFPDSSRANRRLPYSSDVPRNIATGYDSRLFDTCGEYVCTSGSTTRVWHLTSGKLLLSIAHGESIRVTALCFRPSRKIDQEGTRIWLGTNWGEILEVDIGSKKVVDSESSAHSRHEIVKMHRCGTEMWTLDSEGKLFLWPPDDSGCPNLASSVSNGRLGRRPSATLAIGKELWVAHGKEIKIYKPNARSQNAEPIGEQPSSQQGVGDITCAATLSDMVYFGHSDGKISIYSGKNYNFVELVGVSIYKITSLMGLGKYLWAGHTTGMMYVFDTSTKPWSVKKDWRAHSGPVVGISTDRSNLWKLGHLMVMSLGADNTLCNWDGLLENDWLEDDMQDHRSEFCKVDNVSSLVLTWNTGATTPTDLRYDQFNTNFFQELIEDNEYPDIVVFGLQELVDLEDKALTAKSFFKSRQKDSYGHEHLSSVYRAWRDYLSRCLEDAMPVDESYSLLHTASLVGLFSCIFVKSAQISRVRDVQAVEIKTGMGGLHGNKGAIAIRCIMDDSSLCFVNCHLAAGQSKTMDRNNDVAAILESSSLPLTRASPGIFVSGGDGSMIMDSEICILNGDLNYRIDTMSRDGVLRELNTQSLDKLLERDQLLLSKRKNPGFKLRAFQELPITFQPTYKYDVGTDTYDTSEKRRAPAWCDRILYRGTLKQLDYQRHEIRVSDHRPVSASFSLQVKSMDKSRREECWSRCVQRFLQFKESISYDSKLEYLTSVFGLAPQEAQKELASLRQRRDL